MTSDPTAPPPGAGGDTPAAGISLSHVGICVRDLAASLRFYTEGLGFTAGVGFDVDDTFAATLEVPTPVRLRSQFVELEGFRLELLEFATPPATGEPAPRRNQVGFTHLSVHVADLGAALAQVEAAGGTVLAHTRAELGEGAAVFVFCTDPDGVRIELMHP